MQGIILLVKTIFLGISLIREILTLIEQSDIKDTMTKKDRIEMVKELRDGLRMAKKNNDTSGVESAFNNLARRLSEQSKL